MDSRPLITSEVHFAQLLASNQLQIRNKALKKVGRWLESRSRTTNAFTETGMLQLWKGIYYYFWNLDKALIQEQMASVISKYIHNIHKASAAFMYIDAFFQTMAREWFAIDRYRLEKFMMFVRKFLQETFIFLKKNRWPMKMVRKFRNIVKKHLAGKEPNNALGLKMHIADIYMEELARIAAEDLSPEMVRALLVPFCHILAYSDNAALLKSVQKDIFLYLVTQDADPEMFGQFPQLKYDLNSIVNLLQKWLKKSDLKKLNKSAILKTIQEMQSLSSNALETEDEEEEASKTDITKREIDRAARSLLAMQKRLKEDVEEEEVSSIKKKKRI